MYVCMSVCSFLLKVGLCVLLWRVRSDRCLTGSRLVSQKKSTMNGISSSSCWPGSCGLVPGSLPEGPAGLGFMACAGVLPLFPELVDPAQLENATAAVWDFDP